MCSNISAVDWSTAPISAIAYLFVNARVTSYLWEHRLNIDTEINQMVSDVADLLKSPKRETHIKKAISFELFRGDVLFFAVVATRSIMLFR